METICFRPGIKNVEHRSANSSLCAKSNSLPISVREYTIHLAGLIIGVQPQLPFCHICGCSHASEVHDTNLSGELSEPDLEESAHAQYNVLYNGDTQESLTGGKRHRR